MRQLRGHFNGQETKITFKDLPSSPDSSQALQPDDVLIQTKSCALDLVDEKTHHMLLSSSLENCPLGHAVSGIVVNTGANVENFVQGMCVVGIIPFRRDTSGCGDLCIVNQFDMIEKSSEVSHEVASASLSAGLAGYTAVHYLGHVTAGDTVLVLDGATPRGYLTIQLAQSFGAKILTTYRTMAEKKCIENLKIPVAQLIEMSERSTILTSAVMEETGGVGVDCVIDNGVRLFTSEEDKDLMNERTMKAVPHKHDLISCLGFSGRWITTQPHLQLDPPDSQQLFLRGASISFLFPPAWTLMRAQHGRFQHIIRDIHDRVKNGDFKMNEITSVKLENAVEFFTNTNNDSSKAVVVTP